MKHACNAGRFGAACGNNVRDDCIMKPSCIGTAAHAGRYAPSPSGDLHRGSLLAALAAFLQARAHGAPWYLRIDDVDTPRVVAGKADAIMRTLAAFGLDWDGPVLYQSQRGAYYRAALETLRGAGHLFDCGCTRREARSGPLGTEGPVYPGTCRAGLPAGRTARSQRLRVGNARRVIDDAIQGQYAQDLAADVGDFVLRRADGIIAYQLATVVDDIAQGVHEVVRGADLLSSAPRQTLLHELLGHTAPAFVHVPLLVDAQGCKLGKSTGALALDMKRRGAELVQALTWLGQKPPPQLATESVASIIDWGIAHWRLAAVPARRYITVSTA